MTCSRSSSRMRSESCSMTDLTDRATTWAWRELDDLSPTFSLVDETHSFFTFFHSMLVFFQYGEEQIGALEEDEVDADDRQVPGQSSFLLKRDFEIVFGEIGMSFSKAELSCSAFTWITHIQSSCRLTFPTHDHDAFSPRCCHSNCGMQPTSKRSSMRTCRSFRLGG